MRTNGRLPIVLVLLDGLGGPAALVGARTPRLDALATRGANGSLVVVDEGDLARFAVLGYRPSELPGRAVLEARGHRVPVDPDAVYAIATLRPSVVREGGRWLQGHAEPRQAALAARVFDLLDRLDPDVRVVPVGLGRAVVAFAGLASDRLADTGPAGDGLLEEVRPLQRGPLAAGAARRVAAWTHDALRVLQRRRLSAVTLRWFGRPRALAPFAERHGLHGPLVSGTPAFLGAAETIGLERVDDAPTADPAADLRRRLDVAARAIDAGEGLAVCHSDAALAAAAAGDASRLREAVRAVDRGLARLERPPFDGALVCVVGGPVLALPDGTGPPVVIRAAGVARDEVTRFGPTAARQGRLGAVGAADLVRLLVVSAQPTR